MDLFRKDYKKYTFFLWVVHNPLFFGVEDGGCMELFWDVRLLPRKPHQRRCLVLPHAVENPKAKRQRCVTRTTA